MGKAPWKEEIMKQHFSISYKDGEGVVMFALNHHVTELLQVLAEQGITHVIPIFNDEFAAENMLMQVADMLNLHPSELAVFSMNYKEEGVLN